MNITKTLMLAAFSAVSLGVGSAMAQEGGLSIAIPSNQYAAQVEAAAANAPQVQAGSSDVERGTSHTVTPNWNRGVENQTIGGGNG